MSAKVFLAFSLSLAILTALLWAAEGASPSPASGNKRVTESGLTIIDVKTQAEPLVAQKGDIVYVHYTGKLQDGTKFDSSVDRNDPIKFRLGAGDVIKGWDEGIAGMKVGDQRQLIIPPNLGYGEKGTGPIPPNSTLVFDVRMIGIQRD